VADRQYFELEGSEAAIIAAASRIFAAGVAAGQVNKGNEALKMDDAVAQAVALARRVEDLVQVDGETSA
jgi:hypothetical protein